MHWSKRGPTNMKTAVTIRSGLCRSFMQQNPDWPALLSVFPETGTNAVEDENKACTQVFQRSGIIS